jgi:hypothetical protein
MARQNINSPVGRFTWVKNITKLDDYGKYTVTIAFPKTQDISALTNELDEVIAETFGKNVPSSLHNPIIDGDTKPHEYMHGCNIITFKTNFKVPIWNKEGTEPLEQDDIKSGYWGRVSCCAWAMKAKAGKGAFSGFFFNTVQLSRTDEEIGGGPVGMAPIEETEEEEVPF